MASSWFGLDALKRLTERPSDTSTEPATGQHIPAASPSQPAHHPHRHHPSPSKRTPEEEAAFRAEERIGSELRAVRRAAAATDKDVAALSKAVHSLEKETLLFGDLENYLAVIEAEIEAISTTLQRVQAHSEPGGAAAGRGGSKSGG